MGIKRLDHLSVRTHDVEATRVFYEDVLGLSVGPRPEFPFPGLWLYSGQSPVVHVIGIDPGISPLDSSDLAGAFDHIAFFCDDLDAMRARMQTKNVAFRERAIPELSLHQLFVMDPNGLMVELNFSKA